MFMSDTLLRDSWVPSKPLESSKQTTINLENVFIAGYFPLQSEHCLVWICLDVLFCTASIMHLCTISIDRYLSLRYPMRFGRNKTRKRVVLKIFFVWLLSIAMSLPLSLMYSKASSIWKLFCHWKSQLISLGSRFSSRWWDLSNSWSRLQARRINRVFLYSAARNVIHIHINCAIIGTTETELGRWEAHKRGMVEWMARNRSAIR